MTSRSRPDYIEKNVLVTVKAYPNPSKAYRETVCVAGITDEGRFIRLYPVRFRDLESDDQFKTYSWIRVRVFKASADSRPESFRLDHDSPITVVNAVSTAHDWAERRRIIEPVRSVSLEALHSAHKTDRTSLGIIRPRDGWDLVIEPEDQPNWTPEEEAKLRQQELFARPHAERSNPVKLLEKIPLRFVYRFQCDDSTCRGHRIKVISWEMLESYRKYRREYGQSGWESKFRERYVDWMRTRDMHFFMGNMMAHANVFLILGLFYPPRQVQKENAPVAAPSLWDEVN